MAKKRSGGGFKALTYTFKKSREVGGFFKLYRALRTRNTCKTCALGMGGQRGGMVNEKGSYPEVCKKSIQAMTADMQGRVHSGFFKKFSIEKLKGFTPRELESSGRLTEPLYAGPEDTHYKTISWDDALAKAAKQLQKTKPEETFFYFSGRSSNEAGFLLQLLARIYGTNHVNNCSFFCHQASGVGLTSVTGSGKATIVLDDLDGCDLLFLIGANPASNHPRLMRTIVELRRRGGKVIVVNPLREAGLENFRVPSDFRSMVFGSKTCDLYVQPHAGGDAAFLSGVAKAIIEKGAVDEEFVNNFSDGWTQFKSHVEHLNWEDIIDSCGVDKNTIERVAEIYANSQKTVFCWAMGITHHEHGVENVQTIGNLAMTRGMLGKPNCGLLPLRGHSNIQGIGSMGVVPELKKAVFEKLQTRFNIELPTWKGLDTLGCMEAAKEGKMRTAWCLGGNLYGSNPDAGFAQKALSEIGQVVYLSTTLNTGHAHGCGKETIILPVQARDEEKQSTTQESMFSFVRLSDGGQERLAGPRSEVEVIAEIASLVFGDKTPVDWEKLRQHNEIRSAIANVIPGYQKIQDIGKSKKEFHIDGCTFHKPQFATPTGKAQFHVVNLPKRSTAMSLITVRSEGQFNTVVYEEEDLYRGQKRRDIVMLNKDDISKLGLRIDELAKVTSDLGSMVVTVREIDVRQGNAVMYYPEVNVIVPRRADPRAKTPSFKNIPVTITPYKS